MEIMTVTCYVEKDEEISLSEYSFREAYKACKTDNQTEDELEEEMFEYMCDDIQGNVEGEFLNFNDYDLATLQEKIHEFIIDEENHVDSQGQCHLFSLEEDWD